MFWKEAAESEVIAYILIAVSAVGDHQDSVTDWVALP